MVSRLFTLRRYEENYSLIIQTVAPTKYRCPLGSAGDLFQDLLRCKSWGCSKSHRLPFISSVMYLRIQPTSDHIVPYLLGKNLHVSWPTQVNHVESPASPVHPYQNFTFLFSSSFLLICKLAQVNLTLGKQCFPETVKKK